MTDGSKYFRAKEFVCSCGCGLDDISPRFIEKLDKLREDCGFPFIVNSGCRCHQNNLDIGGADNSAHLIQPDGYTYAADIKIIGSYKRMTFLKHAMKYFNRIGVAKSFVHLDDLDSNGENVLWLYS